MKSFEVALQAINHGRQEVKPSSDIEELDWYKDSIGTYWTEYDVHRFQYLMKKHNHIKLSFKEVVDMIYKARAGRLSI